MLAVSLSSSHTMRPMEQSRWLMAQLSAFRIPLMERLRWETPVAAWAFQESIIAQLSKSIFTMGPMGAGESSSEQMGRPPILRILQCRTLLLCQLLWETVTRSTCGCITMVAPCLPGLLTLSQVIRTALLLLLVICQR